MLIPLLYFPEQRSWRHKQQALSHRPEFFPAGTAARLLFPRRASIAAADLRSIRESERVFLGKDTE
jgi:hypothetical protein